MQPAPDTTSVYSPTARRLHWWTVALIVLMLPLGKAMTYRGNTLNIWDGTTEALYSLHKLVGFSLLLLVAYRLYYRLRNGAPPDEPTLEWWQKLGAHVTHWGIYALLIVIPLLGWHGVSRYGAREVFGLFSLPPLGAQDQEAAKTVFFLHELAAKLLILAVAAHVGAALFHYFIRKDGVLSRMLPGLRRRD